MFNYIHNDNFEYIKTEPDKNAVPIFLVSKDEFEDWLPTLDRSHKTWLNTHNFKAKNEEILSLFKADGTIEIIVVGLGNEEPTPWLFSKVAETIPNGTYVISNKLSKQNANLAVFGWAMAQYSFDRYLKEKKDKQAILIAPEGCDYNLVISQIRGSFLTRHLVNTPACDMGPDELADTAHEFAKNFKADISVIKGKELLNKGFNTIHTVGRAAEKEPCLIDIKWGNKNAPKITLVGKGVCFDTGGLDIKPSEAMLIMKKDMGGAAHVLGLGQMIIENKLNVRLRILIPAVENNISGNAFRPGDIIRTYEGTTVEIGNTDAEGRLVLCDALALACEEDPALIIDFATLTGAARVALGTDVPPFFTDDEALQKELPLYSTKEHDPLWQLPLYSPYKKLLASNIADINNVASTGLGGAITAALFLKHFIKNDIPWIHFDVYAWNSAQRPGKPKGGEAMGLRALFGYLCDKYGS